MRGTIKKHNLFPTTVYEFRLEGEDLDMTRIEQVEEQKPDLTPEEVQDVKDFLSKWHKKQNVLQICEKDV